MLWCTCTILPFIHLLSYLSWPGILSISSPSWSDPQIDASLHVHSPRHLSPSLCMAVSKVWVGSIRCTSHKCYNVIHGMRAPQVHLPLLPKVSIADVPWVDNSTLLTWPAKTGFCRTLATLYQTSGLSDFLIWKEETVLIFLETRSTTTTGLLRLHRWGMAVMC